MLYIDRKISCYREFFYFFSLLATINFIFFLSTTLSFEAKKGFQSFLCLMSHPPSFPSVLQPPVCIAMDI